MDEYFRAGAAAIVINPRGLVLAAERSDIPGAWQVPQGGLRAGEHPIDALSRELQEELQIEWSHIEKVDEFPEWLAYELPPESRNRKVGRGQVHRWFLLRYHGLLPQPHPGELRQTRWISMDELIANTWSPRQPIYQRLAQAWSQHLLSGAPDTLD